MLQRQHGLGETGDSGGRLGVAQVALDRPDQQRSVRRPAAAEHGAQRAGLDRITQQGARAVRLDVVDLAGFDPGCRARRAQHGHLGGGVGRHQTVGPPVLVDRGAADDGQDPVAVAFGIGEALEDGDAAALTAHVSVRAGVERVTPAGGRHRLDLVETPGDGRREQHVDAGGQSEIRVTGAQALAGQVDGHQRRRAGGVDGDRRATQIEVVGHPVGDDAQRTAGSRIGAHLGEVHRRHDAVLAEAGSGEHARLGVPQRFGADPGMFERLVGDLQQHALLGVHVVGFARGDLEELGVELVDVGQERTPAGGAGQRGAAFRGSVVEPLPPPRGHLTDRRTAFGQKLPQCLGSVDVAGVAQPEAHHGDRVVGVDALRGRGLGHRLDLAPGEERGQRVDRRVLPELHRRDRAAQQLGELAGEDHGVAGADGEIAQWGIEVDFVRAAADVGDEIVDQPVPDCILVESSCHAVTSKRLNSSWR